MKKTDFRKIGLASFCAAVIFITLFLAIAIAPAAATSDSLFTENTDPATDYAYSFAVVGDTQKHVYRDVYYDKDTTSYIYDWIVDNRDTKKIGLVLGLGDITDKNGIDHKPNDDIDQTDFEWNLATEQLAKLENASIPYTLVPGNHDTVAQLDKYFAENSNFTSADIGYYSDNSLGNYYMRFTIGEHKYLVFAFEYGPNDSILSWASGVIESEENKDYKIIITTHAYMYGDGTTIDSGDDTPPRQPVSYYTATSKNNGNEIWSKFVRKHENIIMVLSGHSAFNNIVWRQDVGDNGNTVFQFLIDPQGLDVEQNYKTGMVAMFYFSEDGRRIKVEYISTYHSTENGKDYVYNAETNCFEFEIPEKVEISDVQTKYGVVPAAYSNPSTYPIVTFEKISDTEYTFIGGYDDIVDANQAITQLKDAWKKNVVILLRANAEAKAKTHADYGELSAMSSTVLLDLDGYRLIQCGQSYVFYVCRTYTHGKNYVEQRVTINVINGSIVKGSNQYALFGVDYTEKCKDDAFAIKMTFDNVTFTAPSKRTYGLFYSAESGGAYYSKEENKDSGFLARLDAVFNNCTFDYANSSDEAIMFNMTNSDGYDRSIHNVTVNGGTIIAGESFGASKLFLADGNENGRADKIVFGKNTDGEYTKLVLPEGVGVSSNDNLYTTADGKEYSFVMLSETDGSVTYILCDATELETKYGTIGIEYADAEEYPIAVFEKMSDEEYRFIGGYSEFGAANTAIGVKTSVTKNFVVLLRGDADVTSVPEFKIKGSYTLDLGEHTLKIKTWAAIFVQFTSAGPYEIAKYTIKNGKIENANKSGGPVVSVKYGTGCRNSFDVDFDFEDVTFSYTATTAKHGIIRATEDNYTALGAIPEADSFVLGVNATFNNCTFDYKNSTSKSAMLNMTASNGGDRIKYNTVVNGGSILADAEFKYSDLVAMDDNTNGRADSITFGKTEGGNYIAIELPIGTETPSLDAEGLVFVKISETDDTVTFRLRPAAVAEIDFVPKMSLTLDRDLILNIYVPAKSFLDSFELDGVEYSDFDKFEIAVLDGENYYLVKTSLTAKSAARNVTLKASVTVGEKTATATFTFGIIKYAEKILADGSAVEKTLVCDVLSYVRAAYAYFDTDAAEAVAKIDAILGENYDENNAPSGEGSATAPSTGLSDVTFVLDATPTIRFYLAENADASLYKFYIDGVEVNTVTGTNATGAYIDLDTYAYAVCETVTYTVDGAEGGSFHINAYYEWSKTQNNAELENLVARFMKYSESARAYKDSVVTE